MRTNSTHKIHRPRLILVLFCSFLSFFVFTAKAQNIISPDVRVTQSPEEGVYIGKTGGLTYTFTKKAGVFEKGTFWGTYLPGSKDCDIKIDMNDQHGPPPHDNCSWSTKGYHVNSDIDGIGGNTLTVNSKSQIRCSDDKNSWTDEIIQTRAILTLSGGAGSKAFIFKERDYYLVDISGLQSFSVHIILEGKGGESLHYRFGSSGWRPVIELFDALNTEKDRGICTSFDSRFYTF